MAKDFLLEIGTEPLPARFVAPALEQLRGRMLAFLEAKRLRHGALKTFGTYRRLAVLVEGLAQRSDALVEEVFGPPAKLLKNEAGEFTPQASGFAKAHGLKPEELRAVATPRGELLCAVKTQPGELAGKLLISSLPQIIGGIEFAKSMTWEPGGFRFARPIRSLLALLGRKNLAVKLAGVRSERKVAGLAAMGSKPILVIEPSKYVETLRDHCVLADVEERKRALLKALEHLIAKKQGLEILPDASLIEESVYLTEHAIPVMGVFAEKFMSLPEKLLVSVLVGQQKFFPVVGKSKKLTCNFVGIRDGVSEGQKEVREGYERVLEARLEDALFYFEKDLKTTLADKKERLKGIEFHPKLGSLFEKSQRVVKLTHKLIELLPVSRKESDWRAAAEIAEFGYADLASRVVAEFPELQGSIGKVFAGVENRSAAVAQGLEEFHYPLTARGALPQRTEAALASLAAKVDTVAGLFAVGLIPTGSEDPHGLRRQGAGIVRILQEKELAVSLTELLRAAIRLQPVPLSEQQTAQLHQEILKFLWQRVETYWTEEGMRFDEIRAVAEGALDNLPEALRRLRALHRARQNEQFAALAGAFKRAANILKKAGVESATNHLDPALFQDEAETELFAELASVQTAVQVLLDGKDYEAGLLKLVELKASVDKFFDKVMVMAEDPRLRDNRLALLARLTGLFKSIADLSQLQ